MQIGNEKEHQEDKEEQGKRQEKIIADWRLITNCPRLFMAVEFAVLQRRHSHFLLEVPGDMIGIIISQT